VVRQETLYIGQEVSLASVASGMWADLGGSLDKGEGSGAVQQATREAGAAMAELGRAAQASLVGGDNHAAAAAAAAGAGGAGAGAGGEESLAVAGARARQAVFDLASSCAGAADEAGTQLDKAWRRDALRAVLALERAPEALQREV
jgi:hypothetical protein